MIKDFIPAPPGLHCVIKSAGQVARWTNEPYIVLGYTHVSADEVLPCVFIAGSGIVPVYPKYFVRLVD